MEAPAQTAPTALAFNDLPDAVVAAIFARVPLSERVRVLPLVCRRWRRCSAAPSAAWHDFWVRKCATARDQRP